MMIPIDQLAWAIAWAPIIAALSLGAQVYGQKRQRDAQRRAQEKAIEQQNRRIAIEAAAASRAHQARMQALAAQTGIADRSSQAFNQDVVQQLGNVRKDLDETKTRRRENLSKVIDRDVAGEAGGARKVGSEVKGRISQSFGERGAEAGERNLADVNRYADRLASIGAFRELPVQRNRQVNTVVRNQLPFTRERESQAAADRLRVARASLIPREPTTYIDTSDPLGELLYGLGQGGMFLYSQGGGTRGPFTTSGGGGTGVSNVQTFTR